MNIKAEPLSGKQKLLRILVYLGIIFALITAVFLKRAIIISKKTSDIPSVFAEWIKNGIPVNIERLGISDLPVFERVTLKPVEDGIYESYIAEDLKTRLNSGDKGEIRLKNRNLPCRVDYVADRKNSENGLYLVRISAPKVKSDDSERVVEARINTEVLKKVVTLPSEAIVIDSEKPYVWRVEGGITKKVAVKTGFSDGIRIVVKGGAKPGDTIVTNGTKSLYDGAKIAIVND